MRKFAKTCLILVIIMAGALRVEGWFASLRAEHVAEHVAERVSADGEAADGGGKDGETGSSGVAVGAVAGKYGVVHHPIGENVGTTTADDANAAVADYPDVTTPVPDIIPDIIPDVTPAVATVTSEPVTDDMNSYTQEPVTPVSDGDTTDTITPPPNSPLVTPPVITPTDAPQPVIDEPTYAAAADIDFDALSNKKLAWSYAAARDGSRPKAYTEFDVTPLGGRYLGAAGSETIYLTFDEGYENGFSPAILDALKEKGVKATFFCTSPFMRSQPELIKRMADEGHTVCSHSDRHISSPDLTVEELQAEILSPAALYKEITGREMVKCFRPPAGEYSERTLAAAQAIGYKSVFWSFAHRDWLTDDQPSVQETYARVTGGLHDGAIVLLHAVSSSNAKALPDIIDYCLKMGYNFKMVDQLN